MSESRIALGKRGEELAAAYLERVGYRIVERNCRLSVGELDIVAVERGTLVFVEVKTRRGVGFGSPLEAVTPRKQRQISRAAQEYLGRGHFPGKPSRFDVIAILLTPGDDSARTAKIELIRNAFVIG